MRGDLGKRAQLLRVDLDVPALRASSDGAVLPLHRRREGGLEIGADAVDHLRRERPGVTGYPVAVQIFDVRRDVLGQGNSHGNVSPDVHARRKRGPRRKLSTNSAEKNHKTPIERIE